jgi:hypothetical protein
VAVAVGASGCGSGSDEPAPVSSTISEASTSVTPALAPETSASFAVWHLDHAPDDFDQFREILSETGARVRSVDTYEEWIGSPADVLVLRGTDESGMVFGREVFLDGLDLAPLKGRRVIGIGGEAGRVFGRLGLEIRDGKTATFRQSRATVVLQPSAVLLPKEGDSSVSAFAGSRTWDCEGLFLPPRAQHLGPVEVVARWASDRLYAPIARQQNYLFWGIPADARSWTPDFRRTFREVAVALAGRPIEAFALAEWDVAWPGTHVLEMKRPLLGSDPQRILRFRFEDPVMFTAELEIERGDEVRLSFHADQSGYGAVSEDGSAGNTIRIIAAITSEAIRRNQGRYWSLSVSNFGSESVRATLRVDHPRGTTVRFPDGLAFEIAHPPRDRDTIARLVALTGDRDPRVAALAAVALEFVGRRAVPALKAARTALEWPKDRDRMVRLSMLASRITGEDDEDDGD